MAIREKKTKAGIVYYVETRGSWERVGGDRREAQRLNERRKKEAKAGTFQPVVSGGVTIGRYLETWLDGKTNRSAGQDRVHIETHVLPREWFAKMKMEDARPPHFQRLVNEIKAGPPTLKPKYIANIFGSVRAAFRAALRQEVVQRDVCLLDPGTISKKSQERVPYSLAEARAIVAAASGDRLIWLALALYTGMRCGEVCGRRWRDWDPESKPLGGLAIATQYSDQPLKGDDDSTDRPRRAPVHPDLAKLLAWWWAEGFELTYMRKPTQDDFIVERQDAPTENLTRSMTYKALESDRKRAGVAKVAGRAQHATRHTFTTQARRASPQAKELVEKITHNAEGEMVDNYTHWEWEPLCSVISAYPSLLPVSETAHGNAPNIGNSRDKSGVMVSSYSDSSPALPSVPQKPSVRVLESELENKGLRDTISEAVSESGSGKGEPSEAAEGHQRPSGALSVDPEAEAFESAVAESTDHTRPATLARALRRTTRAYIARAVGK